MSTAVIGCLPGGRDFGFKAVSLCVLAAFSWPSSSRASRTCSWCARRWAACAKWWRATSSASQVGEPHWSSQQGEPLLTELLALLRRLPGRPAAAGHRPAERPTGRPLLQARPGGLRLPAEHCAGQFGPQGRGEAASTCGASKQFLKLHNKSLHVALRKGQLIKNV